MCAGAMAVISATCGRTMPGQRGDFAGVVHAHFEHAEAASRGIRARLSGTPVWLL